MQRFSRWQNLILPVGIITSVLVILVPLPPVLMDLLLAANITAAVIVLLTTIYVRTPLEFSVFPSLLLAATLARLVLNVATTRLILTRAPANDDLAAGGVIQGFGNFVAGNDIVVGIIIFVIIVVIQFVVITKGATRISEVAARFALDGMPGRQMAIDADLNAGIIDEQEAKRRREDVTRQADFYGAMDGASKFVRGDAIAGIIITVINIFGGLIIGVMNGMTVTEAMQVFTKLTIGDGLVSQVPGFLISLAAALLVTRSTQQVNLPVEFLSQIFSRPQAMMVAGGFVAILIFTKLPWLPLSTIGGACFGLAYVLNRQKQQQVQQLAEEQHKEETEKAAPEERIEDYLVVDPMELDLGVGLLRLADPKRGGTLLPNITSVRQHVASEVGIVLPKVRIRDSLELADNHYRIKIASNPVAEGEVHPDRVLAVDVGNTTGQVSGVPGRDPLFERPAVWVDRSQLDQARMMGYQLAEPTLVLATHLQEIVRRHADDLLTRDATRHLIDELKKTSPAVVDELIPGQMKLAEVQQILQALLREDVPIRQLGLILETLGDHSTAKKDMVWLLEHVRHRLARTICSRYRDNEGKLHVMTLHEGLDNRIAAGVQHTENGMYVRMSDVAVEKTCQRIADEISKLTRAGYHPIILVRPQLRPALKTLTASYLPKLIVMSYNEVTRDTKIESHGLITDNVA